MWKIKQTTAPAVEPITVAEFKTHARIDWGDDDDYIEDLIRAGRRTLERELNRSFLTQTWELYLDAFPSGSEIRIPRPPLQTVNSIKIYDESDVETVVSAASVYRVDNVSEPGRVVLRTSQTWPSTDLRSTNGIVIEFVAGYGSSPTAVPEDIIHLMRLVVSDLYENREPVIVGQGLTPVRLMAIENMIRNTRFQFYGRR